MSVFTASLSAERLKVKNTFIFWLAAAAPLFILLLDFAIFYFKGNELISPGQDPWPVYLRNILMPWNIMFLPMYITLLNALFYSVEHQNNTWKQVLAMPVSKTSVFWSKYLFILAVFLGSIVFMFAAMHASVYLLSVINPALGFYNFNWAVPALVIYLKFTLAALGIFSIQHFISLKWKSFAVAIGTGIAGTLFCMVLLRWENVHYFPFAYPTFSTMGAELANLKFFTEEIWQSLLVFAAFSCLSWFDFTRKDFK